MIEKLSEDLQKRLLDLMYRDREYQEDELYSEEALVNPDYREEVERLVQAV